MKRSAFAVAALMALALPLPVAAHGLVGRVASPLPLVVYLTGAAMAVGLSFAFVLLRDVRATEPDTRPATAPLWLVRLVRAVGLVAWLWIAAQTLVGGSSDASVASLFLWVYGWVATALVSAFIGPIWTWLDPFTTLFDLGAAVLRRLGIAPWPAAPFPVWARGWPAVVGLAFVVWLELVYRQAPLGLFLLLYTVLTLAMMANFGRDAWRLHGETFSVWFGLLNRLAPYGPGDADNPRRLVRRPMASELVRVRWRTSEVVLVALGTGSILYDGLSQTQPWFDLFGLPALPIQTTQLLVFLGLVVGLTLLVARLVGRAALGAGLLPIAVGYLFAHYLTYLLGDGQRLVIAISDPLQLGWDLFDTARYEPGTDWIPPGLLWSLQLVAVVGGHIVGAWAGHVAAARSAPRHADVRLRQVPLAALMVVLTATTLWSLGQAVVDDPTGSADARIEAAP